MKRSDPGPTAGTSRPWDDPAITSFVGTDYLGMSTHPLVRAAAIDAINQHGVSASAARTTTGTFDVHVDLEHALAEFLATDDVVVLASGAHAAAAVIETLGLTVHGWWVDEQAHPCVDAPLAAHASVQRYPHRRPAVAIADAPAVAVLTDAVFPEVGHVIDVDATTAAADAMAPSRVHLCIDESHSVGVLGDGGRGLAHALSGREDVVRFGSLAKALGGFGGFIAARRDLCDEVRAHSPAYTTSTALPPSICAALSTSIETIGADDGPRDQLRANVGQLRRELSGIELADADSDVPIFFAPLLDPGTAAEWHHALLDSGVFVPVSGYLSATGQVGLRGVVTAQHRPHDISRLTQRLRTLHDRAE